MKNKKKAKYRKQKSKHKNRIVMPKKKHEKVIFWNFGQLESSLSLLNVCLCMRVCVWVCVFCVFVCVYVCV